MPPRLVKYLTTLAATKAKPKEKSYRLAAGGGLYLEVMPNGSRYWRMKYRLHGKEKRLALGVFPYVSVSDASKARNAAREQVRNGVDPSVQKRIDRARAAVVSATTFEAVARDWLALKKHDWTERNEVKERGRLENHAFPWIGKLPITEVGPTDIRSILDRIIQHRNVDTAHRVRQTMSCVFRYAIAHERTSADPAHALRDFVPAHRKKRFSNIKDAGLLGELLRAIYAYTGRYETICALKLAPMLLLRPGELRRGEWAEIDFDQAMWTIPAWRMKRVKAEKLDPDAAPHLVPLPRQAIAILHELHALTGEGRLLFPSVKKGGKPMSDGTLNAALKGLGYGAEVIQPHGFRHTASTALNEMGYEENAIERQLSHKKKGVAGIYNAAEYLVERRRILQDWVDYLDRLRIGPNSTSSIR